MECLNCSTKLQGKYCFECGQKSTDLRYTLKGLTTDLFFSAFHVEKKGLPYTIKSLTITPGEAVRSVIEGKRLSLYPPFKYLVLMGALVIILSLRYKFFHNEITQLENNSMNSISAFLNLPTEYHKDIENFFKFAEDKATWLNIAAIPVFAFFSLAFLSGTRYNFAENLILNTYITAQQLFLLLPLVPVLEFAPELRQGTIGFYTIVIILYNIWAYYTFFDGNKPSLFLRSTIVVIVAYIYQFPLNFLIYQIYDNFVHHHMHWIPHVFDNIVN